MKRILLLISMVAISFLGSKPASAQFQLSVNIGAQPEWGPSGYDYAENYYLPDVEAYYSVPRRQFVYFDRGNWVFANTLPGRCANYDLYTGYKVVINERNPWSHFNNHRVQYAPYRYRHDQLVIRNQRGGRYGRPDFDNRNRGRDWGRNNRDNDRRQDRGRNERNNNDRHYDNRYDNRHDARPGRW
ncbi:MAG: hypothetical protein ABIU63_08255 [Chitinophagaceae bacterium]